MAQCIECSFDNPVGAIFCDECGAFLLDNTANEAPATNVAIQVEPPAEKKQAEVTNRFLPEEAAPFADDGEMTPPPALVGQEMSTNTEANKLTFVIPTSGRRYTLELQGDVRIGRADPSGGYHPELDLTRDNGALKGVSRRHATIQQSNRGILLVDLNSTNGTSLNNFRIPPDLPYPIHNGDEIRFGQLLVHVFLS